MRKPRYVCTHPTPHSVILNLFQDLVCLSVYKDFTLFLLVILGKIPKRVRDDESRIERGRFKPACVGLRFQV